jgi:hypothetical protein
MLLTPIWRGTQTGREPGASVFRWPRARPSESQLSEPDRTCRSVADPTNAACSTGTYQTSIEAPTAS